MKSNEIRQSRDVFTKKLEKICKNLDTCSSKVIEHRHPYLGVQKPHVQIKNVWVCGSYARGAADCGDLDLVIQFEVSEGRMPMTKAACKAFFGAPSRVSCFAGNPDENDSGVPFHEAVLVWSNEKEIWHDAISSIKIVEGAGRQPRETDCIPLRRDQLNPSWDEFEDIAGLINSGVLASDFVPFNYNEDPLFDTDEKELERINGQLNLSRANQKAFSHLLAFTEKSDPGCKWTVVNSNSVQCGGTAIRIGRPSLNTKPINGRSAWQIAIIPTPTVRGPNGVWLLSRGPLHPDIQAVKNRKVFTVYEEDKPSVIHELNRFGNCIGAHLFTKKEDAEEFALMLQSVDDHVFKAKELIGTDVLKLICTSDEIIFDGIVYETRMRDYQLAVNRPIHDLIDNLPLSDEVDIKPASRGKKPRKHLDGDAFNHGF